ncbi:MAG: hypothetical protein GF335_03960 [Candidatus Moranbacteria bacterium]|nr:hypothetical protein [Candidatus Moranbacteria bacterium]
MLKNQQRLFVLIIKNLIYSLILYYIGFLIFDIISKGFLSRYFNIGLIILIIITLAFILSKINPQNEETQTKISSGIIFLLILILTVIIFLALLPHNLIVSLTACVCFFLVMNILNFNVK